MKTQTITFNITQIILSTRGASNVKVIETPNSIRFEKVIKSTYTNKDGSKDKWIDFIELNTADGTMDYSAVQWNGFVAKAIRKASIMGFK